jgi:hypothetical protein
LQTCKGAQGTLSPQSIAESAEEQAQNLKQGDEKLRRALRQATKAMASLEKAVMSAARLEPHGGATIACAGIFVILQIAVVDTKQYEFALNSVVEVSPIVERWSHHEKRSMAYDQFSPLGISQKFKDSLVDLYVQIMIHLATMATYCQQTQLRKIASPTSRLAC